MGAFSFSDLISRLRDCAAALPDSRKGANTRFTMADIATDPHYAARNLIQEVEGLPMQGLIAELSATPGVLKWIGRPMNHDTETIRQRPWGGS